MITFNLPDHNLDVIKSASRLGNMLTKYRYSVYGLASGKSTPAISVRVGAAIGEPIIQQLTTLFQSSGMDIQFTRAKKVKSKYKVYLGLGRDLRDHTAVCAAIVQTIVYRLEDRMKLQDGYKLPGIPKTRRSA